MVGMGRQFDGSYAEYTCVFQIAIKDSNPGSVMTAYNKVKGTHASQSKYLLNDALRGEWDWKGLNMSDWFGVYSTTESVNAGLGIEMPGPTTFRGSLIDCALSSRTISQHTLDDRVRNPSSRQSSCGFWDTPETTALLRKVAGESIVLLKNEDKVLPFKRDKTIAIIGPDAKIATISGGESASLLPYHAITPFEGIAAKVERSKIKYVEDF
ncbi:glycoside hydrolase superfamily [Lipomyces starkeyi]